MGFEIKKISSEQQLKIINTTQGSLVAAKEMVQENLHWQTQGLKEQIEANTDGSRLDMVELYKKDITEIKKSAQTVEHRLQRIKNIADQKETLFFSIPKNTTQTEIKSLLLEIQDALKNTTDPAKIQFLETVQETAETCKDIPQDEEFDDQFIPLLTNEQMYARILIANGKLDTLQQSSDTLFKYFSAIKEIYNQAVDSNNLLGLTGRESKFMQTLLVDIEHAINAPASTSDQTHDRLQAALHTKINTLVEGLGKNTDFSYAFKKFINHLCDKLKIISPIFKVTKEKEDIAQKFKQMKTEVQDDQRKNDPKNDDTNNPLHNPQN